MSALAWVHFHPIKVVVFFFCVFEKTPELRPPLYKAKISFPDGGLYRGVPLYITPCTTYITHPAPPI